MTDTRGVLISALVCLLLLGLVWSKDAEQFIQSFTHDDSYYYLQTARNASRGAGFTFDGRNPTNGFHPLWMLILVGLYSVVGGDAERAARAAVSLQLVAFLFPSLVLVQAAVARLSGPFAGAVGLAGAIWLLPSRQLNAMESGVLVLLAAVLFYRMASRDPFAADLPLRERLSTGLLLGLLFLARTDSVFLLVAWAAVALWRRLRGGVAGGWVWALRRWAGEMLTLAVPVLLVAGPYLLWNLRTHGHLMPISGALKTSLPVLVFRPWHLDAGTGAMLAVVLGGVVWVAISDLPGAGGGRIGSGMARVALVFGLYAFFHASFAVFAMKWAVFDWHFALYALPFVALLAHAAGVVKRRMSRLVPSLSRRAVAAALVLVVIVPFARTVWAFRDRPASVFYVASYRAAVWARAHLPPDSRVAMKDSGVFGYFSDRSVTNLDGVINNFEYQTVLARGGLAEYLRAQGIEYVAQHALWEYPAAEAGGYGVLDLAIASRLYGGRGGVVRVIEAEEVYRVRTIDSGLGTHFVIWKYRPS